MRTASPLLRIISIASFTFACMVNTDSHVWAISDFLVHSVIFIDVNVVDYWFISSHSSDIPTSE